jgi:hypothetical protein
MGVTVPRERRWTPAGATPARELVRSNAAPMQTGERLFRQRVSGRTEIAEDSTPDILIGRIVNAD